jgi:protein-S-isoprenylcysteine O-methyltransferase Ste14
MARVERRLPDGTLDNPDLPFKPPLPFVGAIVVGVGLHHWWPMSSRPAGWASLGIALGIALVALAGALLVWCVLVFRSQHTPLEPWKATKVIVDDGPFAYSRNPVYLAFVLLQVGIGLWSDRLAVVALVVVPALMIARMVVPREEAYLQRKFGQVYGDYCARVRRWL